MADKTLPSGIITFLFTDIEGSTPLWEQDPEGMHVSLDQHNSILHEAVSTNGGIVFKIIGDEFQAAFVDPSAAVKAALAAQRELAAVSWGSTGPLHVRMGLHIGLVQAAGDDYISSHTLNRVARIMASGHGGQILLSSEVADLVHAGLPQQVSRHDLGQHYMKGMEQPEHIYQLVAPDLSKEFPPIRSLSPYESNLPTQPTPFVGRETELLELKNYLDIDSSQLLTIVGPGGMGKTRLALAAAEGQLQTERFPDGIIFIPLDPLSGVDQIVPATAQVLGLPLESGGSDGSGRVKQQLLDYLQEKKMLLLFDNFEHLLAGADLVVDIIQSAPDVQILATSRERLRLSNEQVYLIGGLQFPDWETPEDAEEYTAVQLFLQSARRNQPDFTLRDGADLTYLARICRMVAGMPLALELAASWVDVLPLVEIASELQQGLDLLETDTRDMPERHRSIRAMIDYSWQKLAEKEREIFAKLSIFRGGFTREAAKAVTGVNLRQLARLVNKSFLQYNKAEDRYQIHQLLRQYGAEKLAANREQETAVFDQHSSFYCSALQQWHTVLNSDRWLDAVGEIETDYRNILLAWENVLNREHLDQLLIAVNGLGEYYAAKGLYHEGILLFQKIAQRLQADKINLATAPGIAQLLIWLIAWQVNLQINARGEVTGLGHVDEQLLKPGLDILEYTILSAADGRSAEAFLRLQSGRVLKSIDNKWEEGQAHLTTSLHLYRELGDLLGVSNALYEIHFYTLDKGAVEEAQKQLQESLLLLQQLNEPRRLIGVLLGQGFIAESLKAFSEAADLLEKAYQTAKDARYLMGMYGARHTTTHYFWNRGQFDLALNSSEELLTLAREANSPRREALASAIIGMTQVYRGQFLPGLDNFKEAFKFHEQRHLPIEMGYYDGTGLPLAQLHAGYYETIVSSAESEARSWRLQWVYLVRKEYPKTLSLSQQLFDGLPSHSTVDVGRAELRATIALAQYGLNRQDEARSELYQSLQTCVEYHHFVTLMQIMPAIPLLLADTADPKLKERAVELWTMAESLPFVGNSQLYADIVGEPMADVISTLPSSVVAEAQVRGRELDWWETAELLLTELNGLGWNK